MEARSQKLEDGSWKMEDGSWRFCEVILIKILLLFLEFFAVRIKNFRPHSSIFQLYAYPKFTLNFVLLKYHKSLFWVF